MKKLFLWIFSILFLQLIYDQSSVQNFNIIANQPIPITQRISAGRIIKVITRTTLSTHKFASVQEALLSIDQYRLAQQGSARYLVLINNNPTFTNSDTQSLDRYPIASIEQIELLAQSSHVEYAGTIYSGVINLVLKDTTQSTHHLISDLTQRSIQLSSGIIQTDTLIGGMTANQHSESYTVNSIAYTQQDMKTASFENADATQSTFSYLVFNFNDRSTSIVANEFGFLYPNQITSDTTEPSDTSTDSLQAHQDINPLFKLSYSLVDTLDTPQFSKASHPIASSPISSNDALSNDSFSSDTLEQKVTLLNFSLPFGSQRKQTSAKPEKFDTRASELEHALSEHFSTRARPSGGLAHTQVSDAKAILNQIESKHLCDSQTTPSLDYLVTATSLKIDPLYASSAITDFYFNYTHTQTMTTSSLNFKYAARHLTPLSAMRRTRYNNALLSRYLNSSPTDALLSHLSGSLDAGPLDDTHLNSETLATRNLFTQDIHYAAHVRSTMTTRQFEGSRVTMYLASR